LMNLMTRGPKKELMEIEFLRNKYIKKWWENPSFFYLLDHI
jgi:hypothetical protein